MLPKEILQKYGITYESELTIKPIVIKHIIDAMEEYAQQPVKNLSLSAVSNSVCKCPLCGEEMKGIELTHYKCKNCNEYFTD